MPEERKALDDVRTTSELAVLMDRFWRRRDPEPTSAENPFLETFRARVEAADTLYRNEAVRGSLTPRGRALILLGAPPRLRLATRRVPSLRESRGPRGGRPTRDLPVEIWVYSLDDLPGALGAALSPERDTIELVFLDEGRDVRLLEGERVLRLAAYTLAGESPGD